MKIKQCFNCKKKKTIKDFWNCKNNTDGLQSYCKTCQNKAKKKSYYGSGRIGLLRKYGISPDDFKKILKSQKNRCAICLTEENECGKNFVVDHCHDTGIVRGLLCDKCNRGLGAFKDSPKMMLKAVKYLTKGNKNVDSNS